jgi:hypothetical protein
MNHRIFCLLLCLLAGAINHTMAQHAPSYSATYDTLWHQLNNLEAESLPESSAKLAGEIYQKALRENNTPQLLKSIVHLLKYRLAIDSDLFPEKLQEIETLAETTADTTARSLLHAQLANLYLQYYRSNRHTIDRRTALTTAVPDDMREWTGNIFIRKIVEHVTHALQPAPVLQSTDVLRYKDILTAGQDARRLRPTLYDFLLSEAIRIYSDARALAGAYFKQTETLSNRYLCPVEEFVGCSFPAGDYDLTLQIMELYRRQLDFRLKDSNPQALLMADLDRLTYVYQCTNDPRYMDALSALERQYPNDPFAVEILYRQADYYFPHEIPIYMSEYGESNAATFSDTVSGRQQRAYDICRKAIAQYPNYARIGLLKNKLNILTDPQLSVVTDAALYPGQDLQLKISYRNIPQLNIALYRVTLPPASYLAAGAYKTDAQPIGQQVCYFDNARPYTSQDTLLTLPVKDFGLYEIVFSARKDEGTEVVRVQSFSVGRLTASYRSSAGKREYLVTDRISGRPIEKAALNLYRKQGNHYQQVDVAHTDRNGLASIPDGEITHYQLSLAGDCYLPLAPAGYVLKDDNNRQPIDRTDLFTDRAVYRPGQTVFFKGIVTRANGDGQQQVVDNASALVKLYDAQGKTLAETACTTNEFGSFTGAFTLPQQTLAGSFRIDTDKNNGSCSFRVEAYKRPTFHIVPDTVAATYSFGDTIPVTGSVRTFSGMNMQQLPVEFRVVRKRHWFRSYLPGDNDGVQVATGTAVTDGDGRFLVSFPAEKPYSASQSAASCYLYEVSLSVTALSGETQQSTARISIGDRSLYLDIARKTTVDKDLSVSFPVRAYNLNGQAVVCRVDYRIARLSAEQCLEKTPEDNDLTEEATILSGAFSTGDSLSLPALNKFPSGKYRITLQTTDDKGRPVEETHHFILYSFRDKRPPVVQYQWLAANNTTCAPGEAAEIVYGSSARNVYVLFELWQEGQNILRNRFVLNNANRKLSIPFKSSYGKSVDATFTFVKDNRLFTEKVTINRKQEDRRLHLKMDVFRDRLFPGQTETWKLSARNVDGSPTPVEVLAGMYDLSLDRIWQNDWRFYPATMPYRSAVPCFSSGADVRSKRATLHLPEDPIEVPGFALDAFNWFGLSFSNSISLMRRSTMSFSPPMTKTGQVLMQEALSAGEGATDDLTADRLQPPGSAETAPIQLRSDFNETAFFYPQLRTNEAGESLISFTVPESNTAWKFHALAHTKDVRYAQLEEQLISRKPLMVAPNMPRFVRQGDRVTLTSHLSNASETSQSGSIRIELLDPQSERPLISPAADARPFNLDKGQTIAAAWSFEIPEHIDMLLCKITARSENFSDGEQHLVPVLPNRMLVTESLPLPVFGKGERQFRFDKLLQNASSTAQNHRLTLEFASHPAWYAVQALPAMVASRDEDAVSCFASYYSGALASFIANSNPSIKRMVDVWNQQGATPETLLSNLEKNQELKAILLEETPWALEASGETEQKQRLSSLFDLNRNRYLSSEAMDRLKKLQLEDGGWSWFKGMYSSVSITQWMLHGMGQLEQLSLPQQADVREMQRKALQFIDRQFRKSFDAVKKTFADDMKQQTIGNCELEYLYVRSFYPTVPSGDAKEATDFYLDLIDKRWSKNTSLYQKALAAMILQRNNREATAARIAQSLREHATRHPDTGMYWANNRATAFFFRSATILHTFLMQALIATGASQEEADAMKLWLLKQKQTQLWESTPATVHAVHALLNTGTDWLSNEKQVAIQLGNHTIRPETEEAGTGYIKKTFHSSDIQPGMGVVSISKPGNSPAWGALYWQYYEDMDQITQAKNTLSVDKKLFVESVSATGKMLLPVAESQPLSVGDKVTVRLTVRVDRDMEYVLLKDLRAACFEPVEPLSGIRWRESVMYYQTNKDTSTNFYFDHLPKGAYVFEYALYAVRPGTYSGGTAGIQCLYAPEFTSHTGGGSVSVTPNVSP